MACARNASAGQLAGISTGTTPRRYVSNRSSLTTVTVGAEADARRRSTPRYWSNDDGFGASSSRLIVAVPRTTTVAGFGPSWSTVPSGAVTRRRHVVLGPTVVGISRRAASVGKVRATPSIVQGVSRPWMVSGAATLAFQSSRTRTRIVLVVATVPRVVPW